MGPLEAALASMNDNSVIQESLARPNRRAFKVSETAELLGISPTTVRRLIGRGALRPCRATRHVLIPSQEIDRFLDVRGKEECSHE